MHGGKANSVVSSYTDEAANEFSMCFGELGANAERVRKTSLPLGRVLAFYRISSRINFLSQQRIHHRATPVSFSSIATALRVATHSLGLGLDMFARRPSYVFCDRVGDMELLE